MEKLFDSKLKLTKKLMEKLYEGNAKGLLSPAECEELKKCSKENMTDL